MMRTILLKLEEALERGGAKKDKCLLLIGGFSVLISLLENHFHFRLFPFDAAWFAIIFCGIPIVLKAFIGLVTRFDIKADVLVSLALVASVYIREDFAAGEVAFIMQLGSLLEDLTVAKARAGIERLVKMKPYAARRLSATRQDFVPVDEIRAGDLIRVLAGEMVPVDGVIVSGQTSVNQAVMTGEPIPVDKAVGDEVSSGAINQFGTFDMKATKVGEDSSIQRMIRLVQSADADKAKIVGLADRWATWIVVIALLAAAVTWIITGEMIRAVTILVVFCPCALVLATPTAIMAAIGNAAKHGFLVREGDALERLAKVFVIAFDKTGTLTYGTPQVTAVKTLSAYSEGEIYALAASAEKLSEHPLGKAVVKSYGKEAVAPEEFTMIPGEGVSAVVGGASVIAGNQKLFDAFRIEVPLHDAAFYTNQGCTVVYVAVNRELTGFLVLSDTVREESRTMIDRVKSIGVEPVLLTGDHYNAAQCIASRLGITETHAACLPGDKMDIVGRFQSAKTSVCMVGDGINDAPALKKANVGIAMGGVGSDIAVDAADIALVDDEVKELPHLLALSQRMMSTIKINIAFSLGLNFLAIALAVTGVLGPVIGALVHNAGSLLVIVNSAFLLKWRNKSWYENEPGWGKEKKENALQPIKSF